MRQLLQNHLAPRWVILIYLMSVVEAVGLSVYFKARLTDPEMASMQPLTMATQEASGKKVAQPGCANCMVLARSRHDATATSDYADRDRSDRRRETR